MELEKALFRVHERILSQDNTQQIIKIIKLGFTILGVSLLCVFLFANFAYRNSQGCIGDIYEGFKKKQLNNTNLDDDIVIFINVCSYDKSLQPEPMSFYNYTFYDKPAKDDKNTTNTEVPIDPNNNANKGNSTSGDDVGENNNDQKDKENENKNKNDNENDKEKDKDKENDKEKEKEDDKEKEKDKENDKEKEKEKEKEDDKEKDKDKEKEKENDKEKEKEKENDKEKDKENEKNDKEQYDPLYNLPSYINPIKRQLKSHCLELPKIQMEQAATLQSQTYPKEMRIKFIKWMDKNTFKILYIQDKFIQNKNRVIRNITTAVIYVEPTCYASNLLMDKIVYNIIGIEPIVINEIITNFKYSDLHIKNIGTEESWSWTKQQIFSYEYFEIDGWIFKSLLSFFRINLGLFYTSAVTALYIKISIICSPVFILLIMYCVKCLGSQDINVMTLIQTFPYLGLYLHALRGQKTSELVKSFLKMMLVIYIVYLSALNVGSYILFGKNFKSFPKGLDENFLALLAILELLIMLFIRTRSSLKWFPRVSIILMSTFLFYTQNTIYGFYSILLVVVIFLILGYFCYILEEFEIPGISWNESYHYTPSTHRPRCLYFPIFNLGWYYDLPQLWTMFYPLYGRDHFTQAQLSLVDSNYILLNQTLETAERGNNDLGILIDFPQNNNRNNNENNNGDGDGNAGAANLNQNPNPINQNNADGLPQDIEMQNQNVVQDNQRSLQDVTEDRLQLGSSNQQQSDDLFGDDNQNKSREQHLLSNEERGKFYSGRGVQIGGSVSNAQSRQLNDNNKNSADKGEYQQLE